MRLLLVLAVLCASQAFSFCGVSPLRSSTISTASFTRRALRMQDAISTRELVKTSLDYVKLYRLSIEEEKENRRLCNYRLEAEVPAKEMTSMFEEFKADFKARRFCYPGYRVGVVPPNAMSDVYPFIVKSSVQYAVGQACEDNYIIPVDSETADEADMGDEYLSSILLGTDLTDLTSTWLPGKRLEFNVEFTGVEGDKWDGEEGEDEDEENEGNNENGDNEIQDEGVITDLEQAEVEKPSTPNKE